MSILAVISCLFDLDLVKREWLIDFVKWSFHLLICLSCSLFVDKLGDILDGVQALKFAERLYSAFDEFKTSLQRDRTTKPKVSLTQFSSCV